MFPKKNLRLVNSVLMSVLMVFIMTAIITYINTGMDSGFVGRWGKAFILAWPFAFLIILIFGPSVQKLAATLCSKE